MKEKNIFIKFLFIITLIFVFSVKINAMVNDGKCLNINRTTEGSPAHFDVYGSTCSWDKFVGWKNYHLDHYPSKEEAEEKGYQVSVEQLEALKNTLPKDEYDKLLGSDKLQSIRCNSPVANIETTYSCTGNWGAANSCNQRYETVYVTVCDVNGCDSVPVKRCDDYDMICRCGYDNKIHTFSGCCRMTCPTECSLPIYASQLGNTDGTVLGAFYGGSLTPESRVDGLLVRATDVNWVAGNNKIRAEVFSSLGNLNGNVFHNFYKVKYVAYTASDVQSDCEGFGGGYANFKNCGCSVNYTLKCPIYACDPKEEKSGVCVQEYKATEINADMYAVNPAMNFTLKVASGGLGYVKNEGYQIDETFDYRNCNTSYQSEECGYANILIEAEYMKKAKEKAKTWGPKDETQTIAEKYGSLIDYQTVNLALRLFGGHVSSRGYIELAGIGTTRARPGSDKNACEYDVIYTFVPSTYRISNPFIMAYLNYVTEKYSLSNGEYPYGDYVTPTLFADDTTFYFPCNGDHYGAMCHVNNSDNDRIRKVRIAVGLFFNTIMGNSKLLEHRDALFGYSLNRVQNAELIGEEGKEDYSRVVVNFGDIHVDKIESETIYDCNHLEQYDPEVAEQIKKYCVLKMIYRDSNGNVTTTKPAYCTGKHALRCTTEEINVAVCDKYRTTQEVFVEYNDTVNNGGPVRMIACENPDKLTHLYGIVNAEEMVKRQETNWYTIDTLECSKNTCIDLNLRIQDASSIPPKTEEEYKESENKNIKIQDVSKGFVNDPSVKCILNTSANGKAKYDYSELFGVNTNFCRVYCSDEAIYYIPDRLTIKDGLGFKYDIAIRSYLKDSKNHLISSVVKEKRTCVSEIYYNDFPRTVNWASIYGFSPSIQGKTLGFTDSSKTTPKPIKNYEELYKVLLNVKGSSSGDTSGKTVTENLNEIVYDLYNCNFFSAKGETNVFDKNNITRPRQRAFGGNELNQNVYDYYISKEFDVSNTFGLHGGNYNNTTDCNYDSESGKLDCMKMDSISYAAGSEMSTGAQRIGGTGAGDKIDLENTSTSTIEPVKYCRNSSAVGNACFDYEEGIQIMSEKDIASYNYERMNNKTTTIMSDGKTEYKIGKNLVNIPINDYAILTVTTEIGFYNNNLFQPEPSTGKVKKVEIDADTSRLIVDPYTYPVSKDAYALCDPGYSAENVYYDPYNSQDKFAGFYKPVEYNNCVVTHTYNNLNTYHRIQFNDNYHNKISTYTAKSYYEVTGSQSQCRPGSTQCLQNAYDVGEYRNINRTDLFPNEEDADLSTENTNWETEDGVKIRTEIQTVDNSIFINDEYIDYSFSLTPNQMRNIREYNANATPYTDIQLQDCTMDERGFYLNCKNVEGSLLDTIRSGNGSDYGTILNDKNGLQERNTLKEDE